MMDTITEFIGYIFSLNYGGIPIVIFQMMLLQFIKDQGFKKELIPLLSVVFGVMFGVATLGTGDILMSIIVGISIGIFSVGNYEVIFKPIIKTITDWNATNTLK